MKRRKTTVTEGSDNVYADLGFADAEERLAKAKLARAIGKLISKHGMTQAKAAARLGIDQPKVSALVRGQLSGFSTDRLLRCLVLLGNDVRIVLKASRGRGHVSVVTA
jgi:predicted XRE-type DNA-binding protein